MYTQTRQRVLKFLNASLDTRDILSIVRKSMISRVQKRISGRRAACGFARNLPYILIEFADGQSCMYVHSALHRSVVVSLCLSLSFIFRSCHSLARRVDGERRGNLKALNERTIIEICFPAGR